ncbi:hypothetical protein J6590_067928 [Homalodisca vitripennis]|nr:hypothetical protein J6590_067928 [Homalodisca vitripennis]
MELFLRSHSSTAGFLQKKRIGRSLKEVVMDGGTHHTQIDYTRRPAGYSRPPHCHLAAGQQTNSTVGSKCSTGPQRNRPLWRQKVAEENEGALQMLGY